MPGSSANDDKYRVREVFHALDVDPDDNDELRELAATWRWVKEKRANEEKQRGRIGGLLVACITAFITAALAQAGAIWNYFHGK